MAKQELVTVENIKNPAVKRQMTVASAKMNGKKWRLVNSTPQAEVKKKDVAPVVESPKAKLPETGNSFVNEMNDDLANSTEFVKITEEVTEKSTLQAEYEAKTGKKPDGRWNEGKLKEKIAELKPNDDEAA